MHDASLACPQDTKGGNAGGWPWEMTAMARRRATIAGYRYAGPATRIAVGTPHNLLGMDFKVRERSVEMRGQGGTTANQCCMIERLGGHRHGFFVGPAPCLS